MSDEGPEPRIRTLIVFGIGLLVVICLVIGLAALLG